MNVTHIDQIMINNTLSTETEFLDDSVYVSPTNNTYKQKGGQNVQPVHVSSSVPTGGFPPIYIMSKDDKIKQETSKNRQFGTIKSAISIKDILGKNIDDNNKQQ